MKISDLLSKSSIALNLKLSSKADAIDTMVKLHDEVGNISDVAVYREAILKRESEGSTAVGDGIAIPHAKSDAVKKPGLVAVTAPDGVDYEALDGNLSNILFMIAAPNDGDLHLEVLSRLMTLLMDADFRANLLAAKDEEEFIKVVDEAEEKKYGAKPEVKSTTNYRVLAVTACPTGIAHTYMAAEALEKAGAKMGISIKVETNG